MFFDQHAYDIRCEWGAAGVAALAPISDAVVIVDVLSFSTAVEIAASRGAVVYPFRWKDERAARFAGEHGALLAGPSRDTPGAFTLSPTSLLRIPAGTRLVLPSPNGATLSLLTGAIPTAAGCLRNAAAVARAVGQTRRQVAVIPAGERWPDGSLRPAIEDLLGAGAIIHHLPGTRSPEAAAAEALFLHFNDTVDTVVRACSSGRELIEKGFADDVDLAAALDVSTCTPMLVDGAYSA